MPHFDTADQLFLAERTEKVTGWLLDYAARISTAFLNFQDEAEIPGSLMEIGVYAGKYFSLLYRSAERRGANLVGIDPFQHFTPEQVIQNIGAPVPHAKIHLLKGLSADFRAADLMPVLAEKARFVSIDGSHEAVDVLSDLHLAYDVLQPRGIVSLDDFFNTECFGVVEAVCRFLGRKPGLIPFLFTSNKLFLAPYHAVGEYYKFVERFAAEDIGNSQSAQFTATRQRNKQWAQTEFFGYSILTI